LRVPLGTNPLLLVAVVGTQFLQLAVLAVPPVRDLLSMTALTPIDGLQLALAAILVVIVIEVYKLVRRNIPPADTANSRIAGEAR
jgi:P-type Ca2+ transporter type 2C